MSNTASTDRDNESDDLSDNDNDVLSCVAALLDGPNKTVMSMLAIHLSRAFGRGYQYWHDRIKRKFDEA